ncbi:MAG: serine/threonine-protein kinase [Victivallaceae bacterium]|nr:serine/threonine-protein kinase [Victivallaceae bacterium]
MRKVKKTALEKFQEHSLAEGSLDKTSYLTASDLQIDSSGVKPAPAVAVARDRQTIQGSLDEDIAKLTPKPAEKYKFVRSIGFGGMKAILQVSDKDTVRNVAMAIIPDFEDRPKADVHRFVREARITARLEHPNIVPIHDIGINANGSPYFTMKYLRGHSLAVILKKLNNGHPAALELYTLPFLLRIFVKVANAIDFAHSKKIIHLDMKPENVHVGDFGEVLVLDWGLAKFIGPEEESDEMTAAAAAAGLKPAAQPTRVIMTLDGVAKGTPGYMAPEQAAGKNAEKDERTDIYALGCILYAILTFENPLSNRNDINKMLHDTVVGNIEPPSAMKNPQRPIPAPLEAICLKAMNRLPDGRYQSVAELRNDIFSFMSGHATKAENASPIKKTFLFINRNWLPVLFIATLVLLLAGTGMFIFAYGSGMITVNI